MNNRLCNHSQSINHSPDEDYTRTDPIRSPFLSPWTSPSPLTTSASDTIQRFESSASINLQEYKSWKETKWGEDQLDEVEFGDDDMNLELSLPTVFSTPVFPSIKDFSSAVSPIMESLHERTVAYVLSICDLIMSSEYYLVRPRELLSASRAAASFWFTTPAWWLGANSEPSNVQRTAEERSWPEGDDLMDDDIGVAGRRTSDVWRHIRQESGHIAEIFLGTLFSLAAASSFAMVYVIAAFSLVGSVLLNPCCHRRVVVSSSTPTQSPRMKSDVGAEMSSYLGTAATTTTCSSSSTRNSAENSLLRQRKD